MAVLRSILRTLHLAVLFCFVGWSAAAAAMEMWPAAAFFMAYAALLMVLRRHVG